VEQSILSPSLTSASTTTSDESLSTPSASPYSPPAFDDEPKRIINRSQPPSPSAVFPIPPPGPSPALKVPNKLRKKQRGDDGYISDGAAAKKPSKSSKKKAAKGGADAAESSDEGGGYFSDFGRRKKTRTRKKEKAAMASGGGGAQSGDESDGGYLSEASKKKRGFFRLKSKSSKANVAAPPPVPSIPPPLPPPTLLAPPQSLPIAERFFRSPEPTADRRFAPSPDPMAAPFDMDYERSRSVTPLARRALRTMPSVDSVSTVDDTELDTPATSLSGHGHAQNASEGGSPARKGVRFTPSTRFSGPATAAFHNAAMRGDMPPPPSGPAPAQGPPSRPQLVISTPRALTPSRLRAGPTPSPATSDFSLISTSDLIEPSARYIVPSPSIGAEPLPSPRVADANASAAAADLPAPRPMGLRLTVPGSPSRARFSLAELPPPTPPPSGPLPNVPDEPHIQAPTPVSVSMSAFGSIARLPPSAYSRSSSPVQPGRASPGIFGQAIPTIQRGRESPFPARPVLPQEESSELVRRTSQSAQARRRPAAAVVVDDDWRRSDRLGDELEPRMRVGRSRDVSPARAPVRDNISPGVTYDPRGLARAPTLVESSGKDGDMRSDVALFFFPPEKASYRDTLSPYHSRIAPESVTSGYPNDDDDASVYPPTLGTRSAVDSYYFTGDGSRPASFIDAERSDEIRTRFVQRVGSMWGELADAIPPVPALPRNARVPGPAF
jgi:hypothetical protein